MMDAALANRIAEESLKRFDSLPKTGKPSEEFEWTILAAIALIVRTPATPSVRIVALGTGTKCLGGSELSSRGDLVNDSHAEVLARRAFLRFLLEQVEAAANGEQCEESIFERSNTSEGAKFKLKEGHSFHFFTTHSPCGDGSIFERSDGVHKTDTDSEGELAPPEKRCRMDVSGAVDAESIGCELAVSGEDNPLSLAEGKTGGKLLVSAEEHGDLMAQTIGAIRTKPGRGVRTLSVSCSDKLARWSVMGVQGALLMLVLEQPVYLQSVVLCSGTDHSVHALERAIWGRFDRRIAQPSGIIQTPFRQCKPLIFAAQNGQLFRFRKTRCAASGTGKYQPSPCGIIWCDVSERPHEVEVSGRRHGVTKRKLATPAARLRISKIELFARFARLYHICKRYTVGGEPVNNSVPALKDPVERAEIGNGEKRNVADQDPTAGDVAKNEGHPEPQSRTDDMAKLSYAAAKALSVEHARQWARVRDAAFGRWTIKPDSLGQFFVDVDKSFALSGGIM